MLFAYLLALAVQSSEPVRVEELLLKRAGQVSLHYPLRSKIEVSPGQEFYGEHREVASQSQSYRLSAPFKSSMAGAMGFPFAFAIDETDLLPARERGGWTYYVPRQKKFRAWHGLLGNVLAEGDTVGLRVHTDGRREWFVDNSIHNGMSTIWSRKVKDKDPKIAAIPLKSSEPVGPIHKLIYLGVSAGQVRVRHEQTFPDDTVTRDNYEFPVDGNGIALGAIRGARFKIETKPLGATIEVQSPMTGEWGSVKATQ